jgi:hypothetical protein
MRSYWLVVGLLVACGSGEDDRRPAMPAQGGAGASGGSRSPAGSPSQLDAGQAGQADDDGGEGGGAAEGGAGNAGNAGEPPIIYEMGGMPQNMPGLCDPGMKLGAAEPQALAVPGATLLAMTADERSVAFTTGGTDNLVLYVAERASPADDFVELQVTVPDGYSAASGVSLASDALALVLTRADRSGFAELTRTERSEPFGATADEARFAKINALKPMSGHSVGWPVLSSDGNNLYFVSYFGQAWVKQSELGADEVFDIGREIDEFTLGGPSGEHKLLSGLASDQRAIFFADEASQHAMALFRSRPGAPFYDPLDLGERQGAVPNEDCTRIYSTVDGELVFQAKE